MIHLSRETEALARQLATAKGLSLDDAISLAIEQSARSAGIVPPRRRQTAIEMLAVGAEIAALPLLDARPAQQIMHDIDAE